LLLRLTQFRLHEGVNQYALARNMGTSVQMLEAFYGHTTNRTMATELTKNKGKEESVVVGVGRRREHSDEAERTVASLMVFFCFAFIERLWRDVT
jgi:hypothetical protein